MTLHLVSLWNHGLRQLENGLFDILIEGSDLTMGGGGYSWEFLVGLSRPVLQILTLFQTKECHFPHPFSDVASKIHTHF